MKPRQGMAALWLALAGCAQTTGDAMENTTAPIRVLASQDQCGALHRPAARWIASASEWRQLHAQVNNQWMNPPPPPAVDFSRDGVLVVAMGQRSSGGYGLTLAEPSASVRDGVLTVRVDWREAAPDRHQTQALTNPCLLLKLPAVEFTRIQVVDQAGRVRLEGSR